MIESANERHGFDDGLTPKCTADTRDCKLKLHQFDYCIKIGRYVGVSTKHGFHPNRIAKLLNDQTCKCKQFVMTWTLWIYEGKIKTAD